VVAHIIKRVAHTPTIANLLAARAKAAVARPEIAVDA
jgi:hypothetical protein